MPTIEIIDVKISDIRKALKIPKDKYIRIVNDG